MRTSFSNGWRRGLRYCGGVLLIWVVLILLTMEFSPSFRESVKLQAQALSDAISLRATGKLLIGSSTPTLGAGWGSTPTVSASNGTLGFKVNVGTGGSASTGIVNMGSTATTGWICNVTSLAPGSYTRVTGTFPTTVTVTNYGAGSSAALNWTSADVLSFTCSAF